MRTPNRVLGIVGSYRKGGTIDTVITEILTAAGASGAETHKIYLSDCDIEFCVNCRECMQAPGKARVPCVVHDDQMSAILDQVEQADTIIIGAPVNVGNANALTQRFVERCVGYYYWPWGTPAPRLRNKQRTRKAILVSSSAAPGFMNASVFGTGVIKTLKIFAQTTGADVIDIVKVGLVADEEIRLSKRTTRKVRRAAKKLAA